MGFGIYEVIRVEDMCAVGLFTPLTMPKRNLCSQGIHTLILAIFFGQACSSFMWEYWVFKPLEKKQLRIPVNKIKIIRNLYLNEPIFRRRIYVHHKRKTEITFVKRSQADVIKGFVYITFNGILNIFSKNLINKATSPLSFCTINTGLTVSDNNDR